MKHIHEGPGLKMNKIKNKEVYIHADAHMLDFTHKHAYERECTCVHTLLHILIRTHVHGYVCTLKPDRFTCAIIYTQTNINTRTCTLTYTNLLITPML